MPTELLFSREAKADIRKISDYTEVQWGRAQAKRYLADINRTTKRLLQFPYSGTLVGALGANYRKISSGSHRIFYKISDTAIVIVRILHERMDIENAIGSEDNH